MQRDARAYLWDVREAATAIQGFIAGMDADSYAANPLVHSAVERKFEIIGEALSQLARTDPALATRIPHLSQIVAFRNQLIHGYAAIKHSTVWNVILGDLPTLLKNVATHLRELGEP